MPASAAAVPWPALCVSRVVVERRVPASANDRRPITPMMLIDRPIYLKVMNCFWM